MAAELKHLKFVVDPLLFECFCESHDDEEEEYWCHAVALFGTDVEWYCRVDFPYYQPHHAILVHSCNYRAESRWSPIFFEEYLH